MQTTWEQIGGKKDVPRWVVILGAVVAIGSAVLSWWQGRKPLHEEITRLEARQAFTADIQPDEPIDYEGALYETGDHLDEMERADARFPADRVTWYVDPSGISQIRPAVTTAQVRESMRQAWAMWALVLEIEPIEVQSEREALVVHRFDRIDGAGRTLAWSTLTDGSTRQQHQRYDTGERWTLGPPAAGQISLPTVAAHEIGHAMGSPHLPSGSGALMQPYYSGSVPGPTAQDITAMVRLGYQRRTVPPPDAPDAGVISVPATLQVGDVVKALRKLGYDVTGPGKK